MVLTSLACAECYVKKKNRSLKFGRVIYEKDMVKKVSSLKKKNQRGLKRKMKKQKPNTII